VRTTRFREASVRVASNVRDTRKSSYALASGAWAETSDVVRKQQSWGSWANVGVAAGAGVPLAVLLVAHEPGSDLCLVVDVGVSGHVENHLVDGAAGEAEW
jgi:hypothetical protein